MIDSNNYLSEKKITYRRIVLYVIFACFLFVTIFVGLVLMKKIPLTNLWAKGYEIKGVDISHYQGEVDMQVLEEQGMWFVIVKATEGSSYVDERFEENWKNVGKTDMFSGAYHFFSFDSSGKTQAENFINTVGDLSEKLIPVVDVEYYGDKEKNPPSQKEVVRELSEYMHILEEKYGVKPMIYTTYTVYHRYIKENFSDYPLWIRNVYFKPGVDLERKWDFWQYSDTTELDGYRGKEKYIDCNVFYGGQAELKVYIVP